MKTLPNLRITALLAVALAATNTLLAAEQNPFFAMDTALREAKSWPAAKQAELLKEHGFDGFGTSGYPSDEFLAAFESAGIKVHNCYLDLSFDPEKPGLDPRLKELVPRLKNHGTALWIAINSVSRDKKHLTPSDPTGDDVVVPALRELADLAQKNDVKIALYPHVNMWMERVSDTVRVAEKVNRPNVGVTFNLCHWLKVEGNRDPKPVLAEAMPRLFFVSINGADREDPQKSDWSRLIQPLDAGNYDVAALVKTLRDLGYHGPIGFQGFGIKSDPRDILRRSMAGWRRINSP